MESSTNTTETNKNETLTASAAPDKTLGIVAYLTIIGLVAALILNKDKKEPFASFHIRQSLGLLVTGIALWIVGVIPIVGWLISILGTIFILVLWIMGFINALNGKEQGVPVLGNKYSEWFKNIE